MDPNIVSVPEKNNNIPREAAGKLLFDKLNSVDKNRIALVDVKTGETLTYGDLISNSVNVAANLQGIFGIDKNDIVAIISENSCKFWVAVLAALYLATPLHLLNPGYTVYELRTFLTRARPKLIFCSRVGSLNIKKLKEDLDFVRVVVHFDDDEGQDVVFYKDLLKNCCYNFKIETNIKIEEHVCIICNSSGTTGLPKCVMVTHENFRLNLLHSEDDEIYPRGDYICFLQVIPPYHIYGFTTIYLLSVGGKILIMDQFEPTTFLQNIQNHKVNYLFIVPTLADFLAKSPQIDKFDLSSIEDIYSAAGLLTKENESLLKKRFNLKTVHQIYGLTEAASSVFQTPETSKPGSLGKLTQGHQVKIVDPSTAKILGCNESGEICIKGGVMKGYLNDSEKTQEAIDGDGFLHTGDVGYYDEEYYFYVVDRLKDLIKYKSFQVPPNEIEEILLQHPGVKHAAVVGKPDERCGELPVAFVVKREGVEIDEEEIMGHVAEYVCMEKRLHGGVRFVEEIPKNNVGKILRKQLRDTL